MNAVGLRTKFVVPLIVAMVAVQALALAYTDLGVKDQLQQQRDLSVSMIRETQDRRHQAQAEALQTRTAIVGEFLTRLAAGPLLFEDTEALEEQQKSAVGNGIRYVYFVAADGRTPVTAAPADAVKGVAEQRFEVRSKGKTVGYAVLGVDQRPLEALAAESAQELRDMTARIDAGQASVLGHLITSSVGAGVLMAAVLAALLLALFQRQVIRPLQEARGLMEELASGDGDLRTELPVRNADEISALLRAINRFTGKLRGMVREITGASEELTGASAELARMMEEAQGRIEHQRQETEMVATAVTEMASTVQEVARNTASAAQAAHQATGAADCGQDTTGKAVEEIQGLVGRIEETAAAIDRLHEETEQVGTVLEVIRGIAEQTNLLALNAAIEAARAGEQGRGFAVVADEVRTLAGKTQQSTEEIREIIERLQGGSRNAVDAMQAAKDRGQEGATRVREAASALAEIRSLVLQINDMNTQIASAAEEQNAVAEEISSNITHLNEIGESSSAGAASAAASTGELAEMARRLHGIASQFRV